MAKANKKLREVLEEVVEKSNVGELIGEVAKLNGIGDWIKNIGKIGDLAELLALVAQEAKKILAEVDDDEIIETIAEFLDDKIKLPFFLEPFDKGAFKLIVGYAWNNVIKKNLLKSPEANALETSVVSLARKVVDNK